MPYFETTKDEVKYVSVSGRMYGVRYLENCGKNQKPYVRFSVAYDYEVDDFNNTKNKYLYCCGWNDIADIIVYLSDNNRLRVKVSGKLKQFDYNGEQREQLEVSFVEPLFQIPSEKSVKKKQTNTDWEDAESEFGDY